MSTLGQQLKQLRNNKKLSQPEFAQQAGIEQSYTQTTTRCEFQLELKAI